jgi:hypothetical protein
MVPEGLGSGFSTLVLRLGGSPIFARRIGRVRRISQTAKVRSWYGPRLRPIKYGDMRLQNGGDPRAWQRLFQRETHVLRENLFCGLAMLGVLDKFCMNELIG